MNTGRYRHQSQQNAGFAMILIAALFVAFAVIATAFLDHRNVTQVIENRQTHQVQLEKLQSALTKYLLKEGRLPCPARYSISPHDATMASEYGTEMHPIKSDQSAISSIPDCSKAVGTTVGWSMGMGVDVLNSTNNEYVRGMVPFKELGSYGINEDDAYDGQGDRVMYIVNRQLTGNQNVASIDPTTDFVNAAGVPLGNATGYVSEQATINDKITGKLIKVDFLLISYGPDKMGGLGHDKLPTSQVAGMDCSSANTNVAQKLLNCNIAPTIACVTAASTPLSAINCNNDLSFVLMPMNTSAQTNAAITTYTSKAYFDDQLTGVSVTCPNGTLTRNADGQCSNVYCWGSNRSGQLGNGTLTASSISGLVVADARRPVVVNLPRGVTSLQSIGVAEDINVSANVSTPVTVCGLTGDAQVSNYGDVYCWGQNTIITGSSPNTISAISKIPVQIAPPASNFKFTNIQVGYYSTCGMGGVLNGVTVTPDGNIYCWGNNQWGQLGNGTTSNATTWTVTPTIVTIPNGVSSFTSFSGDGYHWCAITNDTNLYCWGKNDKNQMGLITGPDNNNHPLPVQASAVTAASAGTLITGIDSKGSVALTNTGKMFGWGYQWNSTAPYGPVDLSTANGMPALIAASGGVDTAINTTQSTRDIAPYTASNEWQQCVGMVNSTGIASDTYCKGYNDSGQLGSGNTTSNMNSFVKVQLPANVALNSISVGDSVTCGVGSDGQAYCWGSNSGGQLGVNKTADALSMATTPQAVKIPSTVHSITNIAVGGASVCALAMP